MDKDKITMKISLEGNQGERRYMEDVADIITEKEPESRIFLAIFDGHGGKEAAYFAKKHLWENIKKHEKFNSKDPQDVKDAIREGFLLTHKMMFEAHEFWPKRRVGQNSTSGTTATVAVIKQGYLFVGHVGDSGAMLGQKKMTWGGQDYIQTKLLTKFHKPESWHERKRIEALGGRVAISKGVPRVVWKRKVKADAADSGAVNGSDVFEYVPFLAVSRSLGDCWSYVAEKEQFLVSPKPDVSFKKLEPNVDEFLVLASDGLWGVMDHSAAGEIVADFKPDPSKDPDVHDVSHCLIEEALRRCKVKNHRADNISTIVVQFGQGDDDDILVPTDEEGEETPPLICESQAEEDWRPSLVRRLAFRCDDEEEEQMFRESLEMYSSPELESSAPKRRHSTDEVPVIPSKARCHSGNSPSLTGEAGHQTSLITVVSKETLDSLHFDDNAALADITPEILTSDIAAEIVACKN